MRINGTHRAAHAIRFGDKKDKKELSPLPPEVLAYLRAKGEHALADELENKPSLKPIKDDGRMSSGEFMVCNTVGMLGSLGAGFLFGEPLLGILGTFVMPVPVLYAYHLIKKATGQKSQLDIRFAPSFSKNWEPPKKPKKD